MNTTAGYIPLLAFLWGLAGGLSHCIGMCGIFVAAYTAPTRRPSSDTGIDHTAQSAETSDTGTASQTWGGGKAGWQRHVMFHGGRLISLIALGCVAGLVGDISHRWAFVQGVIAILAGVVTILLSLGFSGLMPQFRIPEPDVLGAGGGFLRRQFVRALQSTNALKPLLIGLFVGLLPCGLTYQALIPAAASGSTARAVETMALFGLGTMPGLLLLGVFGGTIFGGLLTDERFRNCMTSVAAIFMSIIGGVFIWRGIAGL
jgi:sulfite exporter TauE/SafE